MPPTSAIILLSCIYWGTLFGGAITSILFNIPGEPWSVATTFDGHPMARQGLGGQALTAAFTSSFIGAACAIVLVTFFAPLISQFSLKFGPPEFLGVQLLTFSAFVGLGGSSVQPNHRCHAVGLSPGGGWHGHCERPAPPHLWHGRADARLQLCGWRSSGCLVLAESLLTVEEGCRGREDKEPGRAGGDLMLETFRALPQYWKTFARSALIGAWMGIKPGGATPGARRARG